MSNSLQDLVGFSKQKPQGAVKGREVNSEWIFLKKPLDQWPTEFKKHWDQEIAYLFQMEVNAGDFLGDQRLCLCLDTQNCDEKKDGEENRKCLFYARGICLVATTMATDVPISFGLMGALFGISKQRVQQIYSTAQKKIVRKIASDPFLKEFCLGIGIGKLQLPSAEDLSGEIDQLLS